MSVAEEDVEESLAGPPQPELNTLEAVKESALHPLVEKKHLPLFHHGLSL